MTVQHVRVGAYAVVERGGAVLLARWISPRGPEWTLPGGGLEHGEDPREAARREVEEETGYVVALDALLTIDSIRLLPTDRDPIDHHGIRIVYAAHVVGGELRDEVGGSTDMAAWIPLDEIANLTRTGLVDIGRSAAALDPPPIGRAPP